jgi:hypothetical protein
MYRLTARALLVLILVGTFVPVALAMTASAPHACCLRKPNHNSLKPTFNALNLGRGNCCPPMASATWAQPRSSIPVETSFLAAKAVASDTIFDHFAEPISSRPARAPPVVPIA